MEGTGRVDALASRRWSSEKRCKRNFLPVRRGVGREQPCQPAFTGSRLCLLHFTLSQSINRTERIDASMLTEPNLTNTCAPLCSPSPPPAPRPLPLGFQWNPRMPTTMLLFMRGPTQPDATVFPREFFTLVRHVSQLVFPSHSRNFCQRDFRCAQLRWASIESSSAASRSLEHCFWSNRYRSGALFCDLDVTHLRAAAYNLDPVHFRSRIAS